MRVVDASVWVSLLVSQDVHYAESRNWLYQYTGDGGILVEPSLLLPEVGGAIARRTGQTELGHRAISHLLAFSSLRLVSIDRQLGEAASYLAANYRLRGADAVYVGLAHHLAIPLVSWDIEQIERGLNLIQVGTPGTDFRTF